MKENDGRLSFLDINIFSKKGKLATWRKTLSDVYNNFNSFIPETYKTGLIKLLLFWCFSLYLDFVKFHQEIDILTSILYKNSYPRAFIEKCIKELLDRVLTPEIVASTVPKKDLMIVLSYVGRLSLHICTRIDRVMKNKHLYCNLWIVFDTKCKLINFSHLNIRFLHFFVLAFFIVTFTHLNLKNLQSSGNLNWYITWQN